MHVVLIVIVIVFAVVPLCPIVQTTISAEAGIVQGFIVLSPLHIVQKNTAALERNVGLIFFCTKSGSLYLSLSLKLSLSLSLSLSQTVSLSLLLMILLTASGKYVAVTTTW